MAVHLTLPTYTLEEIRRTLLVTPDQNSCINVHVPHPTLPLLAKHIHTYQGMIRSRMDHTLSHTILFHDLHITTVSPLIPRDRWLHLTLYNFTHTLIPPGAALDNTPHRLHLFLNSYNRFPYLQHTHTLNDQTTHCIEIRDVPGLGGTFCDIGGYNFYFLWIDIKTYKNMSEWKYDKNSWLYNFFTL